VTSLAPAPAPRSAPSLPGPDCPLCPRLAAFRAANREVHPDWFNAPVPPFYAAGESAGGPTDGPRLLIVGLAPGLRGANRTGRPFTGDFAGDTLYAALTKHGFARGRYGARTDDGLSLIDCRITNAVRCVPPENKPVGQEVAACRPFLAAELAGLTRLQVILALGAIAHQAVLASLALRQASVRFRHGALHSLPSGVTLADSYHCSRYNTNTGRLTIAMFDDVIAAIRALL
jgi:uracil-DNA glycosylase family 4